MPQKSSKSSRIPPQRNQAIDREFGRHVRRLREVRELTQEALAERAELSSDTIRRLERGAISPTIQTVHKLCNGLGIRVSTLFLGCEPEGKDLPREVSDTVARMSDAERSAFLRFVHLLGTLVGGTSEGASDDPI